MILGIYVCLGTNYRLEGLMLHKYYVLCLFDPGALSGIKAVRDTVYHIAQYIPICLIPC